MMKKISFCLCVVFFSMAAFTQQQSAKLSFNKGDTVDINMTVSSTISQQAMGQSIDFIIDAAANHYYRVTNSNAETHTLSHKVKDMRFTFNGMGQKRNFDSNNEKDLNGQFGGPVKDMLSKKYDMIIDSTGNTLLTIPDTISLKQTDSRLAIISGLLKDVMAIVYPPAKGSASFFKILPSEGAKVGDTWTEFVENSMDNYTNYTFAATTDSTFVIDFSGASVTETSVEMMGSTAITKLNNKHSGKIIADKKSGIISEKTITTESTGTTESSFGSLPVNSKMVVKIITKK